MHRDLKPSNVLFAQDGGVRLGDFGLAKIVDLAVSLEDGERPHPIPKNTSLTSLPQPQLTGGAGTPKYASPEQLAGEPVSFGTDVYSLGVMLVEMLSPVLTEMELVAMLEELRLGRWAPPVPGGAFPVTTQLVAAMTHVDASKRPPVLEVMQNCAEVTKELATHFGADSALPNSAVHAEFMSEAS